MADENGIDHLDTSFKAISESDENLDRLKLLYFYKTLCDLLYSLRILCGNGFNFMIIMCSFIRVFCLIGWRPVRPNVKALAKAEELKFGGMEIGQFIPQVYLGIKCTYYCTFVFERT